MPRDPRISPGLRALAEAVGEITGPLIATRRMALPLIVADWPVLVGEALARVSLPEKMGGRARSGNAAILTIRVAHGTVAIELQHREPWLIERINQHFGYRAIGTLRFRQAPLSAAGGPAGPRHRHDLSASEAEWLARLCDDVGNSLLNQILIRIGHHILTRPGDDPPESSPPR